MLSVFEAAAGGDSPAYTLWSNSTSRDTYDITILTADGRLFKNATNQFKKPASRGESDEDYCSLLGVVFESHDLSLFDLEFTVSPNCYLKVKQKIRGTHTTTILVKISLVQVLQEDFGAECLQFMRKVAEQMNQNSRAVKEISKLNEDLNVTVANQRHDVQEMAIYKDQMQNEMLRKMCLVLNGPKRKIKELEKQVEDLQRRLVSEREPNLTENEDCDNKGNDGSSAAPKKKANIRTATKLVSKAAPKSAALPTGITIANSNNGSNNNNNTSNGEISSVAVGVSAHLTTVNEQHPSHYSQQVFVDGNGINDYLTSQTSQSHLQSTKACRSHASTTQSLNSQSQTQTQSSQNRNRKGSNKRLLDSDSDYLDEEEEDEIADALPPPLPNINTIHGNTFERVIPSQASQSQLPSQSRNELLASPSALDFM